MFTLFPSIEYTLYLIKHQKRYFLHFQLMIIGSVKVLEDDFCLINKQNGDSFRSGDILGVAVFMTNSDIPITSDCPSQP